MHAVSRTRSPAIPSLPGNTPSSARNMPRRSASTRAWVRRPRAPWQKLFAAIDEEPVRKPSLSVSLSARISEFFARLSPRTLAWSASLGAVALLLQAGVIGAVLMKNQTASFQTASLSMNEPSSAPITRDLASSAAPTRALVRFAPEARIADITALLDNYQASIVDGAKGGMFRLQFGNKAMSKDEAAGLLARLQREKIVSLAVATP